MALDHQASIVGVEPASLVTRLLIGIRRRPFLDQPAQERLGNACTRPSQSRRGKGLILRAGAAQSSKSLDAIPIARQMRWWQQLANLGNPARRPSGFTRSTTSSIAKVLTFWRAALHIIAVGCICFLSPFRRYGAKTATEGCRRLAHSTSLPVMSGCLETPSHLPTGEARQTNFMRWSSVWSR